MGTNLAALSQWKLSQIILLSLGKRLVTLGFIIKVWLVLRTRANTGCPHCPAYKRGHSLSLHVSSKSGLKEKRKGKKTIPTFPLGRGIWGGACIRALL